MTSTSYTYRWLIPFAITLLTVSTGIATRDSTVLSAAIIGVVFLVYPIVTRTPEIDLRIKRTVEPDAPSPTDSVEVRIYLQNQSDLALPDIRVVDGIPFLLSVDSGSPGFVASLDPGEEITFSYTVTAEEGIHRFQPVQVQARDLSEAVVVEDQISPSGPDVIDCRSVTDISFNDLSLLRPGTALTAETGSGIEYARHREYEPGDPMKQIDWKALARTGDLTTVVSHEDRGTSVVLCLDARPRVYRTQSNDRPHAVSYGVVATNELLSFLTANQTPVDVVTFETEFNVITHNTQPSDVRTVQNELELYHNPTEVYNSNIEFSSLMVEHVSLEAQVREFRQDYTGDAYIIVITPLLDTEIVTAIQSIQSDGHSVLVLSPDVTVANTPGEQLVAIERQNYLQTLRSGEISVVDWDPDESLGNVIVQATEKVRQ